MLKSMITGKPISELFILVITLFQATMTGCTKERVYENIYEGVRMQKQAEQHTDDPDKMTEYNEYRKERREVTTEKSDE